MRYFYVPPDTYTFKHGQIYICNHPLYNNCTLYSDGDVGLAVVQQRFNSRLKATFWAQIDPYLVDEIYERDGFQYIFEKNAVCQDRRLYPTVSVRKLMWALKMKPLQHHIWETGQPSQFLQSL